MNIPLSNLGCRAMLLIFFDVKFLSLLHSFQHAKSTRYFLGNSKLSHLGSSLASMGAEKRL